MHLIRVQFGGNLYLLRRYDCIHRVWYIYLYGVFTYIWLIFMVNVGKYTSPMDVMGNNNIGDQFSFAWNVAILPTAGMGHRELGREVGEVVKKT